MLRIEVTHTFDVSVAEAFAYITDMKNWPEYWPGFRRSVEQAMRRTMQNLDKLLRSVPAAR